MSKHTPGPWDSHDEDDIMAGDWDHHIATAWNHNTIAPSETIANARLMAASPELLAQLRGWLAIFDREGAHVSPLVATAIKETKAIIAKATGEISCVA